MEVAFIMKTGIALLLALVILPTIILATNVSAVTQDQANAAGFGFHEPGDDWWDPEYKYRLPINLTKTNGDVNLGSTSINFGDYFSQGIIDLASMQLVRVAENESSIPVTFQIDTNAVDVWNPPTFSEVETSVIGSVLAENGTFIGTVFNAFDGSGLMNQSIRFEVDLLHPTTDLKFQFVYQPEKEKDVVDLDYLEIYAGITGSWSSPVRIYRRDLPDHKAWTDYITIHLPSSMNGRIWINMDAPTAKGHVEKYFSIDFVFVDYRGFDGKRVIHYVPEAESIKKITQSNYYPRVQVLEQETMPACTLYAVGKFAPSMSRYYLYFNLMNETNHRVINNDVVSFLGELAAPQNYVDYKNDYGILRIDANKTLDEGFVTPKMNAKHSWGNALNFYMMAFDTGYEVTKEFGTIFTRLVLKNSTTTLNYTAYYGAPFIDIAVDTSVSIKAHNIFKPCFVANNADVLDAREPDFDTSFSTHYFGIFDAENKTYFMISANESVQCFAKTNAIKDIVSINFTINDDILLKIEIANASDSYTGDPDAIPDNMTAKYALFEERLGGNVVMTKGSHVDIFMLVQIFWITPKPATSIVVAGDRLYFALFGHSLQSMSISIDGTTAVGTNGNYSIDVSSLHRPVWKRDHFFTVVGRNEFGRTSTIQFTLWVADSILDVPWTVIVMVFSSIIGFFATIMAVLLGTATITRRRMKKQRQCTGDGCNFKK